MIQFIGSITLLKYNKIIFRMKNFLIVCNLLSLLFITIVITEDVGRMPKERIQKLDTYLEMSYALSLIMVGFMKIRERKVHKFVLLLSFYYTSLFPKK